MNWFYTKIMTFLVGEALAQSDRIRVAVAGAVSTALLALASQCAVCQAFLTPDLVKTLSLTIAGYVVTLIVSITHRDVVADTPVPPPLPDVDAAVDAIGPPPAIVK